MNMQKQKPIWSKILAMLCALALCISMVPAASAARPTQPTMSSLNKVTVYATGIKEFWTINGDESDPAINETPQTDGGVTYTASTTEDFITLTMVPAGTEKLSKSVSFYAVSTHEPVIDTGETGVSYLVSNAGVDDTNSALTWWSIELTLPTSGTETEVTLNAEAVPTYTVTVKQPEGVQNYAYSALTSTTVKEGGEFKFFLVPVMGYNAPDVSVTPEDAGSLVPDSSGTYTYTVTNITSNITITIDTATAKTYTVTFPTGDGYTIKSTSDDSFTDNQTTVNHGENVSFKVVANENYNLDNIAVYAGNTRIEEKDGVYTISQVTEDMTVLVVGVQRNTYQVTWETGTGYSITSNQSTAVEAGGNFTFTVTPAAGYAITKVTANGQELSSTNNQYSIPVNGNTTIAVTATATQYSVNVTASNTTVEVNNQAIDDNYQASYGNLTFTVTPDAGYKVDSVKVDGNTPQHNSDGSYTISVTAPVEIVVTTSPLADITLFTTVTHAELKLSVQTTSTLSDLYSDDIYIIAYGTLYAKDQFDSNALKSKIIEHIGTSNMAGIQVSNEPLVYNYCRGNLNISLAGIAGKTITFSDSFNNVNLSNEDNRYGAGWIALQQGEQTWIITSSTASLNP